MALGAAKVLLIVAVPRSRLPAPRGSCGQAGGQAPSAALRHDEVQVVDLAVLEYTVRVCQVFCVSSFPFTLASGRRTG